MPYTYEQMSPLGKWITVKTAEAPIIVNGRIKTAEGQGPRVRNVRFVEENE
jgi:hypothetical protein